MEYTLRELTAMAHFSYIGTPYPHLGTADKAMLQRRVASFAGADIFNVNESLALGKPYFMQLCLQADKEVITLPNEPLISISQQKTIVETPTVGEGRRGTVKEYICTEDYEISIKGVLVGAQGAYPAQEVQAINELFAINEALEVVDNLFFDLFGIKRIVLKSIQFDEMMGQESMQKYTITAVSDVDFFAELADRDKFLG